MKEAGIDFEKHKASGIDLLTFGEYLITSGLILLPNVHWICFHGLFDFAYLLRLVSNEPYLPHDEYSFQSMLEIYFPNIYDVKTMAEPWIHGSLCRLCQELGIVRVGTQHQAGSDSLVTAAAFFRLKEKYTESNKKLNEAKNKLFGISNEKNWENQCEYEGCVWYDPRYMGIRWEEQEGFMTKYGY